MKLNIKAKIMHMLLALLVLFMISGCNEKNGTGNSNQPQFSEAVKVQVNGYSGNIMEPFLSRDGSILLFNNLNALPENTNLHWATRINDSTFDYKGEITGINTPDLEGVPSLDNSGALYFVSTRSYATSLSTLYQCSFANGTATGIELVSGVSKLQAGIVNFDVEVSADGKTLYFVDGQFNQSGIPLTADLVIAEKNGAAFQRLANSNTILKNINTSDLEYAACISVNQLEFFFTRLKAPIMPTSSPEIFVCTRTGTNEPFGKPSKIEEAEGFVEAVTIAPDQRTLYYHKKEGDKFGLFMIRKK
jgi:hypothetical protein